MAIFAFSILTHQHLNKVVEYLLQFPFRDCERVWKEVLTSADQEQLLHLMAEQLYQSPLAESATQVQHLSSLLHAILRMEEYKAAVRQNFPQLLIALLGMVVNFHYDQEFLEGAKEVLHLLLGTTGEQVEAAIIDQLFCRENFNQGLSAMSCRKATLVDPSHGGKYHRCSRGPGVCRNARSSGSYLHRAAQLPSAGPLSGYFGAPPHLAVT
ncbi:uncharacterized protein LOC132592383 [Zootoca vivipara]|uniref:uncharacterized protein LOC132592383 n=1 Tax=Zootoca vivipara TaxID=8524 RepID=UPI00293B8FF8|nr:uncharacterized protein LOC132592383 [Zootoca vivipara]